MKTILSVFMLFSLTVSAAVPLASLTMLSAATTTSTSEVFQPWSGPKTFHATGTTSAGSGAATILIEGADVNSSVNGDWVLLGTITLTLGTASTGDGFASDSHFRYERARISAISGTGASVNVYMGSEANRR